MEPSTPAYDPLKVPVSRASAAGGGLPAVDVQLVQGVVHLFGRHAGRRRDGVLVLVDGAFHLAFDVDHVQGGIRHGGLRVACQLASGSADAGWQHEHGHDADDAQDRKAEQRADHFLHGRSFQVRAVSQGAAGGASMQRDGCGGGRFGGVPLETAYSRMPCSIKRPQHLQQAVTKPTSDLRNSRVGPGVLGNRRTGVRNAPENRWKPAGCLLGTCRAFAGNAVGFCWERARFPLDLSRASAGVLLDACMIGAVSLPDMRHLFARSACYDGKHGATGRKGERWRIA